MQRQLMTSRMDVEFQKFLKMRNIRPELKGRTKVQARKGSNIQFDAFLAGTVAEKKKI